MPEKQVSYFLAEAGKEMTLTDPVTFCPISARQCQVPQPLSHTQKKEMRGFAHERWGEKIPFPY